MFGAAFHQKFSDKIDHDILIKKHPVVAFQLKSGCATIVQKPVTAAEKLVLFSDHAAQLIDFNKDAAPPIPRSQAVGKKLFNAHLDDYTNRRALYYKAMERFIATADSEFNQTGLALAEILFRKPEKIQAEQNVLAHAVEEQRDFMNIVDGYIEDSAMTRTILAHRHEA